MGGALWEAGQPVALAPPLLAMPTTTAVFLQPTASLASRWGPAKQQRPRRHVPEACLS